MVIDWGTFATSTETIVGDMVSEFWVPLSVILGFLIFAMAISVLIKSVLHH